MIGTLPGSLSAIGLVALVGILGLFSIMGLTAIQRGNAHILDVSGIARTHSQQIAYLAMSAVAGEADPDWRAQLEASIVAIETGSRVAAHSRRLAHVLDPADEAQLDADLARYFAAARALEADPTDRRNLGLLRALHSRVLAGLDRIVKLRARDIAQQTDTVVQALLVMFAVGIVTLVFVWFGLIAPAERRLEGMLAAVSAERAQVQSLFDNNPDAIALYDNDARLVRANRARAELIGGVPGEMVGRHISEFVDPARLDLVLRQFEAAKRGERYSGEMELRSASGAAIDVDVNVFPSVIGGSTNGVMIVSRDMRQLRAAQSRSDELARRLAALCGIVSVGGSWMQQIEQALQLAANALGCEWGVIGELAAEDVNVLCTVGDVPGMQSGMRIPLELTLTRSIINRDDVFEQTDLAQSPWHDYNKLHGTAWRHIVGMRLTVNGEVFGSFAVASAAPRSAPLSDADREFVRTVVALIGSIIDRGYQHARLDSLAFFDTLTGLPNRAYATNKLDDLIARGRRDDSATFALHFIDLDKFKAINDGMGHSAGDFVLREVGRRFVQCTRTTDTVARLGGDEFVILQPHANGRDAAGLLAERVVKAVERPIVVDGKPFTLGCSIGISMFPLDGQDAQTLLKCADEAMYRAKTGMVSGTIAFASEIPITDGRLPQTT